MKDEHQSHPPLFASAELAARIESAEREMIAGAARAARTRGARHVMIEPIAGGLAVYARPDSPLNKVVGVGVAATSPTSAPSPSIDISALDSTLDRIEKEYFDRGCSVQFELSTLANPAIAPHLAQRGYMLQGFENVLGRRLNPRAAPDPNDSSSQDGAKRIGHAVDGLDALGGPTGAGQKAQTTADPIVRELDTDDLGVWIDVVVAGFAEPESQAVPPHESFPREALHLVINDMAQSTTSRRFLAHLPTRDGLAVAGGASLSVFEGVALFTGAATLPHLRRRGVQSALLDTRLGLAAQSGCDLAAVTTQPGSKSQHNVQRRGFQLLYSRAVMVRPH